jgi:hypothetical protein
MADSLLALVECVQPETVTVIGLRPLEHLIVEDLGRELLSRYGSLDIFTSDPVGAHAWPLTPTEFDSQDQWRSEQTWSKIDCSEEECVVLHGLPVDAVSHLRSVQGLHRALVAFVRFPPSFELRADKRPTDEDFKPLVTAADSVWGAYSHSTYTSTALSSGNDLELWRVAA